VSFDLATFVFQAVNFLVLVAVLWRLLWRPLRRHMAGRAQRIDEGLTSVEEGQREVDAMREETQKALRAAEKKENEALRAAEREGEARRNELLEAARADAAGERDRLLSQVEREQERREREFLRALMPGIERILDRLLRDLGDAARLHDVTCERFARELRTIPAEERTRLVELAERGAAEMVSATGDVPPALSAAIAELLPSVSFSRRTDPALVGGALLRVGEVVLDGSVSAQVRRVVEQAA